MHILVKYKQINNNMIYNIVNNKFNKIYNKHKKLLRKLW